MVVLASYHRYHRILIDHQDKLESVFMTGLPRVVCFLKIQFATTFLTYLSLHQLQAIFTDWPWRGLYLG